MDLKSVAINGKVLDLRSAVPLTVGDFRALKKKHSVDVLKMGGAPDLDHMVALARYAAAKAEPSIVEADIDSLTLDALNAIVSAVLGVGTEPSEVKVDLPT